MTIVVGRCGQCTSNIEQGDLRCAVCGFAVPHESVQHAKVDDKVMRCDECSAAVAYDADARAPKCAFCGATMHVDSVEDPLEQTEMFVPFSVDQEQAGNAFRAWTGSLGFFRPSDLSSEAKIDSAKPLYFTSWVFQAKALISWTADSNHGRSRSSWAPHSGQKELSFQNLLVPATLGLTDEEANFLAPGYDLATGVATPPAGEDAVVEQFEVQRSMARERITEALTGTAAAHVRASEIPGTKFRHVRAVPLISELLTQRVAFSAWVMAYRYKKKLYRAVLCGQDVGLIKGSAPFSITKIALVTLAGLGVIALAIALLSRL